jgi:hypothetical protein
MYRRSTAAPQVRTIQVPSANGLFFFSLRSSVTVLCRNTTFFTTLLPWTLSATSAAFS